MAQRTAGGVARMPHVLDLANCGLANGANLNQWPWLNNICQRFHLRRV